MKKHVGQASEKQVYQQHWEHLVGQVKSTLPFISKEASQYYHFHAYVFVKSNKITCPFASPESDPFSSAITGIYYHGNLHLKIKLEESPGYPTGPVLVVPLQLSCSDNMQFQEKKERIDLQNTTLICICKAIQSGKKWGGRLEEKKRRYQVTSKLVGRRKKLWLNEAVSCPTKLYHVKCYLKHTLYLATKFLYGALFCRISAVKMLYIPQIAAAETTFQRKGFLRISAVTLVQNNLCRRC